MSMEQGQIVGSDLSPNANIQGIQIADKTILYRNFSDSVERIALHGTAIVPGLVSPASNTTATPSLFVTIAHNLGYTPTFSTSAINIDIDWWGVQKNGQTIQMPIGYFPISGNNNVYHDLISIADSMNLTIYNNWTTKTTPFAIPPITVSYKIYASQSAD